MTTEMLGMWNGEGRTVVSSRSLVDEKPLLTRYDGRWHYVRTYVEQWRDRNAAAAVWCDRRNYFIGIKAGIRLGRALDCTARGCPVPRDETEVVGDGPYN